jgi:hypothetical protein
LQRFDPELGLTEPQFPLENQPNWTYGSRIAVTSTGDAYVAFLHFTTGRRERLMLRVIPSDVDAPALPE